MAQYQIIDVLQRYVAKQRTGAYRFPREIINSIQDETGINGQLVEMVLKQNGFLTR